MASSKRSPHQGVGRCCQRASIHALCEGAPKGVLLGPKLKRTARKRLDDLSGIVWATDVLRDWILIALKSQAD